MYKLGKVYAKAMLNKYLAVAVTGTVCLASSICCVSAAFRPNIDDADADAVTIIKEKEGSQYKDLYNYVFYSFLYDEFPEIKEAEIEDRQKYLDSRMIEGQSLSDYIKEKANTYIEGIYNYNIVYGKSEVDISSDIEAVSTTIKENLQEAAQKSGLPVAEYLTKYYEYTGIADFDEIIYSISVFTAYKNVYLEGKSRDISEGVAESYYQKYKNYLDTYTFSYFMYTVKDDEDISDKDKKKRQSRLNNLYENSHSLEDFDKLCTSFAEEYSDATYKKKKTYSYEQLYRANEKILSYIIDAKPGEDELCLINKDGTIIMIYFVSRQKNNVACYNGYYIKGNDLDTTQQIYSDMKETGANIKDIDTQYLTEFKNASIQEIGFTQEQYDFFKDSPTPFYIYDNEYQRIVYIEGTSVTWYQKIMHELYYEDLCKEAESRYIPLAQMYMFREDMSVLVKE